MQSQIINDDNSKYIVVAAGPGSGKTMVLVHKLAALILLEDIKYEQLLMLTFSRAAATEFKKRLFALIGSAAKYIDIKTFHSYCFDLLEKTGNLNDAENVIKEAVRMINADEVERNKIVKSVLVIDEAQDMDGDNYALIKSLIAKNDSMRIIAVGDDDQNIYSFRGSESKYMQMLINDLDATCYEMVDNYRSKENIISLANALIANVNNKLKHQKINAVQKQAGNVEIIYHETEEIASATVEQVKKLSFTGSSCILTDTNEEALKIYSLLAKNKIKVKLIQSLDGFNVYNLMEVKHFIKIIDNNLSSPIIDEQLWNSAIEKIKIIYKESTCLENVLNMLSAFAQINSTNKYRSDLQQFIRESKYEDFCLTDNKNIIYVSTIHKAKGKEFDNVWLSLAGMKLNNDDDYRKLYVAITRAKNNLYIHHHSHIFDNYWLNNVSHIFDEKSYSPAQEIILSLTLRDVVLDYFLNKNDAVIKLRSGVQLKVSANYLLTENNISIVKLSETMVTKVDNLRRKGYLPYKAEIRFIVCWKKEGSEQETGVVLPDIYFKKI